MGVEEPELFEMDSWIEHLRTNEGVQESFEESRKLIESACGIALTQIELVGLRRITERVLEELYGKKESSAEKKLADTKINLVPKNHGHEIFSRFMQEFYDMNPGEFQRFSEDNDREMMGQYFKRMQERAHRP